MVEVASQTVEGEFLSVLLQPDPSCTAGPSGLIIAMACLIGAIVVAALVVFLLLLKYNDRFRMCLRERPDGGDRYSIQLEEPPL
jgi:hypothetical protein